MLLQLRVLKQNAVGDFSKLVGSSLAHNQYGRWPATPTYADSFLDLRFRASLMASSSK